MLLVLLLSLTGFLEAAGCSVLFACAEDGESCAPSWGALGCEADLTFCFGDDPSADCFLLSAFPPLLKNLCRYAWV